eukprot:COSAG05_NODE_2531_length_2937_cov_705.879140_2_plen_37_part_00
MATGEYEVFEMGTCVISNGMRAMVNANVVADFQCIK